jgi:hypothetical protein
MTEKPVSEMTNAEFAEAKAALTRGEHGRATQGRQDADVKAWLDWRFPDHDAYRQIRKTKE